MTKDRTLHKEAFSYFYNQASNLLFLLNREGRIIEANEYARSLTGKDMVGLKIQDVVIDFNSQFDLAALVMDSSKEHLISVSTAKGLPQSFYFTFKPIADRILAFGRLDAEELESMRREVLALNQELNNLTRELHQKNAKLTQKEKALNKTISDLQSAQAKLIESEKMASLGRLVAGFAHEINTPMGIALTASSSIVEASQHIDYILTQEEVEEDDLVSTLETIRDASKLVWSNINRSAKLVGSFKRTSVDQSYDTVSEFCLNDAIKDVLTSMRIKTKNTPIQVAFESREKINLFGNPGDIFQVISNIFENSVLHGFDAGKREGSITIGVEKKDENIIIRYADTGKGMSIEEVNRIFEPFYTTSRARGGTGLGMYICHNIVTSRLNGTIECNSTPGGGTEFKITFPYIKEEVDEAEKIQKQNAP